MKITFVSQSADLSGGSRVIAIHAERLLERGHDTLIVTRRPDPPGPRQRVKEFLAGRWRTPETETHFDNLRTEVRFLDHSGPVTDKDVPDADAIIATWWETAFAVAELSPQKGRKFHFIQHHEVHEHLPRHISAGCYHLPLKKIAVSGWLVDTMRDRYGDHNVSLVTNSVDTSLFFEPERGRQPVPTVGLMYYPTVFKGLDIGLAAIEKARTRHPDLRLVAFGMNPVQKQFPLPDNAHYHLRPEQNRLRQIYASCDVFLFGSRSEGFGLPILEAMACRTPVVATRTGCAPDVVDVGVTGFLADIGDVESLAEGISRVLSQDDPTWRAMSNAARRSVESYSWERAADLFEKALVEECGPLSAQRTEEA